jgi:hypothetical protein
MIVSFFSVSSINNSEDWKIAIISVFAFAVVFLGIGAFLMYKGHTKIANIKKESLF